MTQRHSSLSSVRVSLVASDSLKCFPGVMEANCTHSTIPTGNGVPDRGDPIFWWINRMLGKVKDALHGAYPALRPKYLQRYLSEFCDRFNRRSDLAALVQRLIVAARGHHYRTIGSRRWMGDLGDQYKIKKACRSTSS